MGYLFIGRFLLILSGLLWALDATPFQPLGRLSNSFGDTFSSIASKWWPQNPEVVLLHGSPKSDENWHKVSRQLHEAQAKAVAVTDWNHNFPPPTNSIIPWYACQILNQPHSTLGVLNTAPSTSGVRRHQTGKIEVDGVWKVTLEGLISDRPLATPFRLPPRLSPAKVPNLPLDEALDTDTGKELIKGKIVVIETRRNLTLRFPLQQSFLSGVEYPPGIFHALAVDTMSRHLEVKETPDLLVWLISFSVALVLTLLQRPLGMSLGWLYTIVWATLLATGLGFLFVLGGVYFPIAPGLCLLVFGTILLNHGRWKRQQENLQRVLLQQSAYLSQRVNTTDALDREDTWQQMAELCRQLLNFRRAIFLNRVEGDHRLKEIVSIGTNIDAIEEMRRDYHREPYKTVIKEGRCRKVQKYLEADPSNPIQEVQLLSPLLFEGEVVGFWALGFDPENIDKAESYLEKVDDLSTQLSRLVVQRNRLLMDHGERRATPRSHENESAMTELRRSVQMLMDRVQSSENILESLSSSLITYNVFGRVEQVNRNMQDLLRSFQIQAYDLTLLDFLSKISGLPESELRNHIREIVMEQQAIVLAASNLNRNDKAFQIHLVPLLVEKNREERAPSAFRVTGILCELADLSDIRSTVKLKDVLFERLYYKLKNDLEMYTLCADMLSQQIEPEELPSIGSMLSQKVNESGQVLDTTKETLQRDIISSPVGCFPVEVHEPIKDAVARFEGPASQSGVTFERNISNLVSLAMASPDDLGKILDAMIRILIDDAIDDSVIRIEIVEMPEGVVYYDLANEGMGMPPNRFQSCLYGEEAILSKDFRLLHEALETVNSWGGELSGDSELGRGIHFRLQLKTVI